MKLTESTLKQMIKEVLNELSPTKGSGSPGPISADLARKFGGQPDMATLNKKLDDILKLLQAVIDFKNIKVKK
tara:strand:- start:324 stop:542 length:219 start_codon:yes stop_codon:yes gene_type:complete